MGFAPIDPDLDISPPMRHHTPYENLASKTMRPLCGANYHPGLICRAGSVPDFDVSTRKLRFHKVFLTMTHIPTLHMLCGKIAAGKSTLANQLGQAPRTVLISEDEWLAALFPGQLNTLDDYIAHSRHLRTIMGPHVTGLLSAGVSVVLDYPANMVRTRAWMREIIRTSGAAHVMHLLDPPDAVCLKRLRKRNAQGDHAFAATEAQFHQFAKFFEPPQPEEGFEVVVHQDIGADQS
ncbi:ATP-binding protein [Sulfitobacter sp. M368]|uniref:AAA family ATPase n=1 Tax=Sulfitobacter sp. M368 TaxID=2867021 RepID=UPI00288344C7|nr:ATP-binding protein [Sulfitobacter sp. M368]